MAMTDTSPVRLNYLPQDDPALCTYSSMCNLPAGSTAGCYANQDTMYPNNDQFCGYVKNGTLFSAPGCCRVACPSASCPSVKASVPQPLPPRAKIDKSVPYTGETQSVPIPMSSPFVMPKLALLMILIFLILLVAG